MNKIYKVIWSKVKNQYVVVSELAHSNGKQSRTSRNSIRSRIAALVVCGAIAAFGVFSALPNSAFAYPVKDPTVNEYVTADVGVAQAEKYQYVAIKTDENGETKTYTDSKHNEYNYHSETIGGTKYWVRDGYSLKIEYGNRYPDSASDKQVIAYKTTIDSNADKGLLRSDQLMIEAAKNSDNQAITSFTGYVLNDVTAGTYVGATNQGGTQTPDDWNYFIQDSNGKYVDVSSYSDDSGKHPEFVEAEKQADGTYTVYGNVVSTDNLYVIGEVTETKVDGGDFNPDTIKRDVHYRLGAFVTSEGEVYTGRVFGQTNEVLMTAKDENGEYYSYWAAPTDDPNAPITNMTMGQFNTAIKEIDDNTRGLAGDDIKQIDVKSNGGNAGGTIGLLRRGNYNKDTGKWEGTEYAPGTITVTSEGGTNDSGKANDVKIKFASENGGSFTVDAGSKVEGLNSEGTATAGDTLTGIKINGVEYDLSQGKTYSPGQGIAINDDDNKISVRLKVGETNLTVDDTGLALNKDLTVDSVNAKGTTIDKKGLTAGNVKVNAENATVTGLSNTTWDTEIASAVEANENGEAGYAATQGQLKDVADTAGTAEAEAKKHTTVKLADGEENLTLDEGTNAEGGKEYTVALDKELNVTSVNAEGTTISAEGLKAGNVKVNAGNATITGLSNTTWDTEIASAVEDNKNGEAGYAATQGQLKDVADAAGTAEAEAKKHTTVKLADGEENLTLDEGTNAEGGKEYTVALDKELNVTSVNAEGTTISAEGLKAGNVKVNAGNATITGLSNTTWDTEIASAVEANENGEAGYAATQGQLKDVADTAGTAEAEAKKHTTVKLADGEENLTLDEGTNAEGGKEYTVALDKELNVTSVNAEGTTISAEGLKAGNVKVNAGNATITGLSNTTWDTEIASAVEANENGEAGYAATQGQLKDVADAAGTAEAEAKKHTTVKLADGEENLTLDEGTNAEGGKEYTVALDKELNVTSVNAEGTTISAEGLKAGNVKVNAGNATITGLSNTTWDTEIASAVEANENGEAGYAATQGQLQKVSEAANEGWTAYINGFETEVKDIHPGNDYFSFNEGDNISITKSEDGNGIVISSDLTNLDVDDTNAVIYDNEGKTSVTLAGSSGTTITNLKAGQISETSTDAVNGSQLYAT